MKYSSDYWGKKNALLSNRPVSETTALKSPSKHEQYLTQNTLFPFSPCAQVTVYPGRITVNKDYATELCSNRASISPFMRLKRAGNDGVSEGMRIIHAQYNDTIKAEENRRHGEVLSVETSSESEACLIFFKS